MKSYTDLEQSLKLAKFLPFESADMYYISGDECDICFGSGVYEEIADWLSDGTLKPADIPCWSLSALLMVLPNYQLQTQDDGIGILCSCNGKFNIVTANNPVDACVTMIEKLNELICCNYGTKRNN